MLVDVLLQQRLILYSVRVAFYFYSCCFHLRPFYPSFYPSLSFSRQWLVVRTHSHTHSREILQWHEQRLKRPLYTVYIYQKEKRTVMIRPDQSGRGPLCATHGGIWS